MRLWARMEMELWSIFFKDFLRVEGKVNGEVLEERILREILKRDFCEKEKKREREKESEQCVG